MVRRKIEKRKEATRLSPIKVMHVIHSLDVGGAEQVVANYARFHDRSRFSPSVCALRSGGRLYDQLEREHIRTFIIGKGAGADLRALWRLVRLIHRERIDILHTHNPTGHLWGLAAARFFPRLCVIGTEHSIHYQGRAGRFYLHLLRRLGRRFDYVIACSDFVRATHEKCGALPSRKYLTIHNGISIEQFVRISPKADARRQGNGEKGELPVIGAVGSLTPHKGHAYLLSAIAKLHAYSFYPRVMIVGNGPLYGDLKEQIIELDLTEQVILLGARDNIPEVLTSFDIFVLPSLREGFPITILEAMAAGLPVIATDVGGNKEAIVDGETGMIVPPADPDELALALRTMLEDPKLAREMGRNGRNRVTEKFQVGKMVAATEGLYDDVTTSRRLNIGNR